MPRDVVTHDARLNATFLQRGDGWMYGGPIFLGVGYYLLFGIVLSAWALHSGRHVAPAGTKRIDAGKDVTPASISPGSLDVAVDVGIASTLQFEPATLAFRAITYDVVHSQTKKTTRLLRGVTGIARPGTMTALMGASGAGASE